MGQMIHSAILMGDDTWKSPGEIRGTIEEKLSSDGERYLYDIDKFEITIDGVTLGRKFFYQFDRAQSIDGKRIVVASEEVLDNLDMYSDVPQIYTKILQGKTRFQNIELAANEIERNGFLYICAADLADLKPIMGLNPFDARIENFGELKNANIDFMPIDHFGDFRRQPAFINVERIRYLGLDHDEFHIVGIKEPQDYLLHLPEVDLEFLTQIEIDPKMTGEKTRSGNLKRVYEASKERIGRKDTILLFYEILKSVGAYNDYKEGPAMLKNLRKLLKLYQAPAEIQYAHPTKAGSLAKMESLAARLFTRKGHSPMSVDDMNIGLSDDRFLGFYRDRDSVQDYYFGAMEILEARYKEQGIVVAGNLAQKVRMMKNVEIFAPLGYSQIVTQDEFDAQLKEMVRYHGIALLDLPSVKRDIPNQGVFFANLRKNRRDMANYTNHERNLYHRNFIQPHSHEEGFEVIGTVEKQ